MVVVLVVVILVAALGDINLLFYCFSGLRCLLILIFSTGLCPDLFPIDHCSWLARPYLYLKLLYVLGGILITICIVLFYAFFLVSRVSIVLFSAVCMILCMYIRIHLFMYCMY